MASITPTVGRVVWFYDQEGHGPLAAQIAYVHSPSLVNLGYLAVNGESKSATSVTLVQEGEPKPNGYYAEWMPYQKGQAAKTEALEQQAAGATPCPTRKTPEHRRSLAKR
jgi:hypothetical protein